MRILLIVSVCLVMIAAPAVAGDLSFSVRPDADLQTAHLGLAGKRFVPYVGLDYLGIGVDARSDQTYWQRDTTGDELYISNIDRENIEVSGTLVIPHVGLKVWMGERELRPYLFGHVFKSLAFVSAEGREENLYFDGPDDDTPSGEVHDLEIEDEDEEALEALLGFWGLAAGFGAEYFFREEFSVSGEYLFRLFFFNSDRKDVDEGTGGSRVDWRDEVNEDVSASLRHSQATVAVNFYFR